MMSALPRSDFPLLAASPRLVYLDSAATTQKPRAVLDAIRDFYENDNANPHRGAYALSVRATQRYRDARARVATFLGVSDADCLVFTRGTTESLNLVAASWGRANIRAGDEIVVTGAEHHANFVPWQQVAIEMGARFRICELDADGAVDLDRLRAMVGRRTKVVAFAHVSNVLGTIAPVREIVELAHGVEAIAVCDGAQAAPHLTVRFDASGVDFFAASGHKMLGPMGIGVLAGRRELLDAMPPFLTGGDMIEFVEDEHSTWNRLPHKFEAGTPNAAGAVGMAAAVDVLERVGMDAVRAHERGLVASAYRRLSAIEGVRIYGPGPEDRSGVLSFNVGDVHPHDLATILDSHHVCIRAGHHCAQPLMRRLGVSATARASFYVYNDDADIDALVNGVMAAREMFSRVGA
ncbi:MAG TPA: SufS family cysteine desulfurase [Gemmatimonadaceae bacterium]|nr:SufS family cysteine desulfurase [Gemmatimonadaceae bacterium]